MTGVLVGQEKSTQKYCNGQDTFLHVQKYHRRLPNYIQQNKVPVQNFDENQRLFGVLLKPCASFYAISWAVTLGHNENAAWSVGWAKPPKGLCEVSKIHCHPSENKPAFLKLWKVSVRFLWVTAVLPKVVSQNREENWAGRDETPNPNDNLAFMLFLAVLLNNKK